MIQELRKSYPSRCGRPTLTRVDTAIWSTTSFGRCMEYPLCNDSCCTYGVEISVDEVRRLEQYAQGLELYTGVPRKQWFSTEYLEDDEFPGQGYTCTTTTSRGCVFLSPAGRGCMIHRFCLQNGIDYHELKPMVSCLFPLTFDRGLLRPALDVDDQSLVCLGRGLSLYTSARTELTYYFGPDLIRELDDLEATRLVDVPVRSDPKSIPFVIPDHQLSES